MIPYDLHSHYRTQHDTLHSAYQIPCATRCPVANHLLLQEAVAAVRIVEQVSRGNNREQ